MPSSKITFYFQNNPSGSSSGTFQFTKSLMTVFELLISAFICLYQWICKNCAHNFCPLCQTKKKKSEQKSCSKLKCTGYNIFPGQIKVLQKKVRRTTFLSIFNERIRKWNFVECESYSWKDDVKITRNISLVSSATIGTA